MLPPIITVIIATALQRTNWLINRSLVSVYQQTLEKPEHIEVLIIDDNKIKSEFYYIQKEVEKLREKIKLPSSHFKTRVLRNQRTPFMSGTGAWNTGIFKAYSYNNNGYVAILDDDDEYLPHHLADCIKYISPKVVGIFQRLRWKNQDHSILNFPLLKTDLQSINFFIGNPGIQGSNMFFKTESLIKIGGFDEQLPNTTDRDLMVRFLRYIEQQNKVFPNDKLDCHVIEKVGVIHYNHAKKKVNNDFKRKQIGLDLFYKKYRSSFSNAAYEKSLIRAKRFFNYRPLTEK